MPWHDGLDGPARAVAEVCISPLRVMAGPGTGKTRAFIRRVARLLDGGANPERILVVTFTRTAARDLVKQLRELRVAGAERVRAGTLHSFCFSSLARAEVLDITGRHPRPLLDFERRFLVEDLGTNDFGGVREKERRLRAFEAAWARLQSEEPGWPRTAIDRRFQEALFSWFRFHQAMLIGELVPETLKYLRHNPACPERQGFDHILVDEYQDLNRAEQCLVDLLAERGTLAIVGDEDQSIYSFKFAHPQGISQFHESHPGTHDERLAECQRCPRLVVALADELIGRNHDGAAGLLAARPGSPEGEVCVVQWESLEEEAEGLARLVHATIARRQAEPGRILVLCPRRLIGYRIRDALGRVGVAGHSFFHEEALEGNAKRDPGSEAQAAFTLLSLLANPEDRVALRCWLGFGSQSLRKGAYDRLRRYCEANGAPPATVLRDLAAGRIELPYTGELVDRYRDLMDRVNALGGRSGQALLDALFPSTEAWAEPVRVLAGRTQGDFGGAELREAIRLGITQPELPTDVDYVRIMSLHKSKGLTADMVAVAGCIEGLSPYVDGSLDGPERERSLQEQRRLFYVAITRTTSRLVLSSVTTLPREHAHTMRVPIRSGDHEHGRTIASRFLHELGASLPAPVRGADWLIAVGAVGA